MHKRPKAVLITSLHNLNVHVPLQTVHFIQVLILNLSGTVDAGYHKDVDHRWLDTFASSRQKKSRLWIYYFFNPLLTMSQLTKQPSIVALKCILIKRVQLHKLMCSNS